jgi:hypothetical protein
MWFVLFFLVLGAELIAYCFLLLVVLVARILPIADWPWGLGARSPVFVLETHRYVPRDFRQNKTGPADPPPPPGISNAC